MGHLVIGGLSYVTHKVYLKLIKISFKDIYYNVAAKNYNNLRCAIDSHTCRVCLHTIDSHILLVRSYFSSHYSIYYTRIVEVFCQYP